jgi:transposase
MSSQPFTQEFNEEAVRQIIDRKYSVAEVSARLSMSAHSLCSWSKLSQRITPNNAQPN